MSLLRQALGTAQTPPNQVLLGLALFLTIFIMMPVFSSVYDEAVTPYFNEDIGFEEAVEVAREPFRTFMLNQTRESDIALFVEIAGNTEVDEPADVPFSTLVPAFITSELKSAFSIGFLIYIPFVVIDLVVASVLMSMGMMTWLFKRIFLFKVIASITWHLLLVKLMWPISVSYTHLTLPTNREV